jgi:predicted Zn-dependent protease
VRYNQALALQRLGRRAEAEAAFLKARQADPDDLDIGYALAVFYVQANDWPRARDAAASLAHLSPGSPQARELLDRIEQSSAGNVSPRRSGP